MANIRLNFLAAILAVCLIEIRGHGMMTDPINRSSMGTSGMYPDVPKNWTPNENFCGGREVQHGRINRGRCGPCGDNYQDSVPRKNENGGLYGMGHIVKNYTAGEKVKVGIDLSANHLGHYEFNICELKNEKDVETEECFDEHPLKLVDQDGKDGDKYSAAGKHGVHEVEVYLPKGYTCKHCVLRWNYIAGNNWGMCEDGVGRQGCGGQETFRSCADISIV